MLTMLVSRGRVLLCLLVLPVGVMVGRLMMMVCGSMMVCSGLVVMLDGRVFGLVCHGLVLLDGFGGIGAHRARDWVAVCPPVGGQNAVVQRFSGPRLKRPSNHDASGEAKPCDMPWSPPTRLTESASGEVRASAGDRSGPGEGTWVDGSPDVKRLPGRLPFAPPVNRRPGPCSGNAIQEAIPCLYRDNIQTTACGDSVFRKPPGRIPWHSSSCAASDPNHVNERRRIGRSPKTGRVRNRRENRGVVAPS